MTEHETHFQRADLIASEALGIALEKERSDHQETKRKLQELVDAILKAGGLAQELAKELDNKEETFNWKKS